MVQVQSIICRPPRCGTGVQNASRGYCVQKTGSVNGDITRVTLGHSLPLVLCLAKIMGFSLNEWVPRSVHLLGFSCGDVQRYTMRRSAGSALDKHSDSWMLPDIRRGRC
jgi:hypothetical protein